MSANFAYDQVPPEYERDEPPEPDGEPEGIAPPDAPLLGRPSADALLGARIGLSLSVAKYEQLAKGADAHGGAWPGEADHWRLRAQQCREAIEWLDRGAP